jgi:hypothetical protein
MQDDLTKFVSDQLPLLDLWIFQRRAKAKARSTVKLARVTTPSP